MIIVNIDTKFLNYITLKQVTKIWEIILFNHNFHNNEIYCFISVAKEIIDL